MSDLGDITREAMADTKPLVVVERGKEWNAAHESISGNQLYGVLMDCCGFIFDDSASRERETLSDTAKRERQQRRKANAELNDLERKARSAR